MQKSSTFTGRNEQLEQGRLLTLIEHVGNETINKTVLKMTALSFRGKKVVFETLCYFGKSGLQKFEK